VIAAIEKLQSGSDFGPIDLLVNNAGISPKSNGRKRMSWETSPDEWRRVIDVNLNGYFFLLRAVLPGMIERRAGAIVNISSLAGLRYSAIAGVHYCASKAAVIGLTSQVAGEVAGFGVRVNSVAPGRIETEMAAEAGAGFNEEIKRSTPLGRLGIPQDIAQAVCFLLSDKASFITGQSLVVSGGRGL
jgi:3-oxoacyl-[acyl-carrier protein] reductase